MNIYFTFRFPCWYSKKIKSTENFYVRTLLTNTDGPKPSWRLQMLRYLTGNTPLTTTMLSSLQKASQCYDVIINTEKRFRVIASSWTQHSLATGPLTFYRKMSWSLEAERLWFRLFQSPWNLTGTSADCCRDVCHISERYDHYNIQSRGIETSLDLFVFDTDITLLRTKPTHKTSHEAHDFFTAFFSWGFTVVHGGFPRSHYYNTIMGVMASLITSITIVYSTLLFKRRSEKISKLPVAGFGNSQGTSELPAQMASNTENVFIWWRHHEIIIHILQGCFPGPGKLV